MVPNMKASSQKVVFYIEILFWDTHEPSIDIWYCRESTGIELERIKGDLNSYFSFMLYKGASYLRQSFT